jgi:hypothetical protein
MKGRYTPSQGATLFLQFTRNPGMYVIWYRPPFDSTITMLTSTRSAGKLLAFVSFLSFSLLPALRKLFDSGLYLDKRQAMGAHFIRFRMI